MQKALRFIQRFQYPLILGVVVLGLFISMLNRSRHPSPSSSLPLATPSFTAAASPEAVPSVAASPSPVAQESPRPIASSSPQGEDSLILASANFVSLDTATQTLYYLDPTTRELLRTDLSTGETTSLATIPASTEHLVWSPDHAKAILIARNWQDENNTNALHDPQEKDTAFVKALFDIAEDKISHLNANIRAITFLGKNSIIYQYMDRTFNNLSIARHDGTRWKNIATLKEGAEITRSGDTALVKEVSSNVVTRYNEQGETIATYTVPGDLYLSRSTWLAGEETAVYWTKSGNHTKIRLYKSGKASDIATLNVKSEDLTILWDNKNSSLYTVTLDGLTKLNVTVKP